MSCPKKPYKCDCMWELTSDCGKTPCTKEIFGKAKTAVTKQIKAKYETKLIRR